MTETFHKYPHTPHLVWRGSGTPRDDKVLKPTEVSEFLAGEVIVEEKVDGANLGISIGPAGQLRAQSRGNYLKPGRCHAQWAPLWSWLAARNEELLEGLHPGLMLFGEWCYARHTVPYRRLPDWFLGFDIFDTAVGRFWSVERRDAWLRQRALFSVPEVTRGPIRPKQASSLLGSSALGDTPMEGIYLRREKDSWLESRAKVVSLAFQQQIEQHWTRRPVIPNQLALPMALT